MSSEGTPTPAADEVWTVKRVLDWSIDYLKKNGSESPRLDAEILLAHARGCQRIQLYTEYDAPLTPEERASMRDLVKRRAGHEPVAYLVGFREFFGMKFDVEPGVLIPRPDTESLVVTALEQATEFESPRILDLCTGTACVALAIVENCRNAAVTAVELDDQAFEVARRNIEKHHLAEHVALLKGDLFEPLSSDDRFDLICSNPPYVTDSEMDTLQPDVRLHEPELALRAGPDGLDMIRRIIPESASWLESGGSLLLEIGESQGEAVIDLFSRYDEFVTAQIVTDLEGRSRVVWARRR